jgi:protein-disulfide isomerase
MSSRREEKERLKAERLAAQEEQQVAEKRRRIQALAVAIALAALIVGALIVVSQSGDDDGNSNGEPRADLFRGIPQQGIALGERDAPVTIVEFADLQCPFCAQFSDGVLGDIVARYVRPGDVRMELRLLSFIGPDSIRGAEVAAAAAEQDRAWSFAEAFFANQGAENSGFVTDEFLRDIGGEIAGLDIERAMEEAGSAPSVELLSEADSLAAESGVNSTPSFQIGPTGGKLRALDVGRLELGPFADAIDAELDRAGG